MKVGDLVQVSAYGKKLKLFESVKNDTGILITQNIVMWSSMPNFKFPVNRRDIKKVR